MANSFYIIIEASSNYLSNAPILEILINGAVVKSATITTKTGTGSDNFTFLLDYPISDLSPSSISFRFNDNSVEGGRNITIENVRINGQLIDSADLSQQQLLQNDISNLNIPNNDHLFGRIDPTQADFDPVTITGTAGDDKLQAGIGDDVIDGGAGNDRIRGVHDDDAIDGGDGNDTIFGEAGNDIVIGGNGNDLIFGNAGDDILFGQADNDVLLGGAGNDVLNGGIGNDSAIGGAGDDIIFGEDGDDTLVGVSGNDILYGDAGNDTIAAGTGDDTMYGGDGADDIIAASGNDVAYGGIGNDFITADAGNDFVDGGADNDMVYGGTGNDQLEGGTGNDQVFGDSGNDIIDGEDGNDLIVGGVGSDNIAGGAGEDIIYGNGLDSVTISAILRSNAGLVYSEYTNSFYKLVTNAVDYYTASNAASVSLINGVKGSIVSITSAVENSIVQNIAAGNEIWLSATDSFAEGEWRWQGGIEDSKQFWQGDGSGGAVGNMYNNWNTGEPNDWGSGEDNAVMYTNGTWNDLNGITNNRFYVIEWEASLFSDDNATDFINGDAGNDIISGDGGNDTIYGGLGVDIIYGGLGDDTIYGAGKTNYTNPEFPDTSALSSYGGGQDAGGKVEIIDNGEGFSLEGNLWKKIPVNYNVTTDTILEFEFKSTGEAEISGIGFDNDNSISSSATFKLYGTQNWGISDFDNYNGSGNWQSYSINVGNYYTGTFSDLFFINDDDAGGVNSTDNSWFRNIKIYDATATDSGANTLNGNDGNDTIYGGSQDDIIYGDAGNDTLNGNDGRDIIYGDSISKVVTMEAGEIAVSQSNSSQWHSISFSSSITSPIVKMFGQDVTGDPFTLRVRNVTNGGFEFQIDEYDYQDGSTGLENISWFAVASGSYTLSNGTKIEAGTTTLENEITTNISFSDSFSSPIVFSQVMSDNEMTAVVTRNSNVNSNGFRVRMQEEEANPNLHSPETVGWIAMEAGGTAANGFLIGETGNNVIHDNFTVNFDTAFDSTPIFVADMQTIDGGDTANTAGISISTTSAVILIDEETSRDAEIGHTTENVGYIALNAGTYTAINDTVNGSDTIKGGSGNDILYADSKVDSSISTGNTANPLSGLIMSDNADAYWDLSEITGTTADNQGSLGASVDGRIYGSPNMGATKLYTSGSTSIEFDGINDGIRIPDSVGINTASKYPERTVELVFNADDIDTRQVLYEEGGTVNGFTIYIDGGRVYVTGEDDGNWVDANINAEISVNTTYHVAFVFDQPNNSFTGYLNGVNIGSVSVGNQPFPSHGADIGIGYAPDGVQFADGESGGGVFFYFDGKISDVALYNQALTQSQIQERANIVKDIFPPARPIDDTIYGGDGFDQMYGGDGGRDVFVFESVSAFNNIDQINGFDVTEQDALDITDILTGYDPIADSIADFVQITENAGNSIVAIDANGTVGGSNYTDMVQINGVTDLNVEVMEINYNLITS